MNESQENRRIEVSGYVIYNFYVFLLFSVVLIFLDNFIPYSLIPKALIDLKDSPLTGMNQK
jgi:hypothetical protein